MIFCVEDDAGIRELMVYTLNASGFEAVGFPDGAALFQSLENQKPQLIMLDIMLPGEHTVTVQGQRIQLTLKEYELLQKFMANPGLVFTREQLLSSIWGTDFIGETRTVDVHIGTLRTKLGPCGSCIETVRGVGYCLGSKN